MAELNTLRVRAKDGAAAVAAATGRSIASVKSAANRYRISLRPTSERRGKVLGEPRDGYRTEQQHIRDGILSGDVDPIRLEAHLQHIADDMRGVRQQLCPACTARPIEKATGLCTTCHTRALTEAYRHAAGEKAAERELVNERQRRSRRKRPQLKERN